MEEMGDGTGDMGDMMMMGSTMKPEKSCHKMWTYFHTQSDDTILFDFWMAQNAGQTIYSCFIIFGLALLPEVIKFIRWKLERFQSSHHEEKSYLKRLFMPSHFLQTILFGTQLALSYALMLVFMTFNVWLCIAVVAGMTLSYLVFGSRQQSNASSHF